MQLGISSYITSAGLNATVNAGALGPSFSPKYFLPIYSPEWDKHIRQGTSGTSTSAVDIDTLGLFNATDATLDAQKIEKIFANSTYKISDKIFIYQVNGIGTPGSDAQFSSKQSVASDVNLLNNKPLSLGISATSYLTTSQGLITPTGRYDFNEADTMNIVRYNPISAANPPLSAYYRVASYSPSTEGVKTKGVFKCRIPSNNSSFKFNGVALYLTKTDIHGFDDNGFGNSMFNFKPVLFAIVLFDHAQYKEAGVGGINDWEIDVEIGFDYDTIDATNAGNPVYIETNYWTKLPNNLTTSAYGLNYDGDVVVSTSAINNSWISRGKVTITENSRNQLVLAHDTERYTNFRTIRVPLNGVSNTNDRAVLSVDTLCPTDALLQFGPETSATGIKSIAMGCKTSATGYGKIPGITIPENQPNKDGGYTIATGVESWAAGYLTQSHGNKTSAFGYGEISIGEKCFAGSLEESILNPGVIDLQNNNGFNFAFGLETSAVARDRSDITSDYYSEFIDRRQNAGFNLAIGNKAYADGGMSTSHGVETSATGFSSLSYGYKSLASEKFAFAFGNELSATGSFSVVFGSDNLNAGYLSTVFGNKNEIYTGRFNFIHGFDNSISGTNETISSNIIFGESSLVRESKYSVAFGQSNNIYNSELGYVLGRANNVSASNSSYTFGSGNDIKNSNGTRIFGMSNGVSATDSNVMGFNHQIKGQRISVIGASNTLSGSEIFVNGQGNQIVYGGVVSETNTEIYPNYDGKLCRSLVYGFDNYVKTSAASDKFGAFVFGNKNKVYFDTNSFILGTENQIEGNGSNFVLGSGNTLGVDVSVSGSFVLGTRNVFTSDDSIILGKDNVASSKNSILIGNNISTSKENSVTIGSCSTEEVIINAKKITIGKECVDSIIDINIPREKEYHLNIELRMDKNGNVVEGKSPKDSNFYINKNYSNSMIISELTLKSFGEEDKSISIYQKMSDHLYWEINPSVSTPFYYIKGKADGKVSKSIANTLTIGSENRDVYFSIYFDKNSGDLYLTSHDNRVASTNPITYNVDFAFSKSIAYDTGNSEVEVEEGFLNSLELLYRINPNNICTFSGSNNSDPVSFDILTTVFQGLKSLNVDSMIDNKGYACHANVLVMPDYIGPCVYNLNTVCYSGAWFNEANHSIRRNYAHVNIGSRWPNSISDNIGLYKFTAGNTQGNTKYHMFGMFVNGIIFSNGSAFAQDLVISHNSHAKALKLTGNDALECMIANNMLAADHLFNEYGPKKSISFN